MKFKIFTLYPDIFTSFLNNSLIARGLAKEVIDIKLINWRDTHGKGVHKQVDDKPFGGGSGMVLQCEPIHQSLTENNALSSLFASPKSLYPNNSRFYELNRLSPQKKVTILTTPRGFPLNQDILYWLSTFEEINILSGRFEGFDDRVNNMVDVELSLGDFVLNGGEVASMAIIEGVSRLTKGFITKESSIDHDSFSKSLNYYAENSEYSKQSDVKNFSLETSKEYNLFDNNFWYSRIEQYEHPIYTRPVIWNSLEVPAVLVNGNHKLIQKWQINWYKNNIIN